jgi:hypothetical protein
VAVTRRSVLMALVRAGGLALTLGRRVAIAATSSLPTDSVVAKLRSLVSDPVGARCIGQIYLSQASAESDPTRLASLILSSLDLTSQDALRLQRAALSKLFGARVRADFAAGRTVVLSGWILSRTEARVCALWT